MEKCERCGKYDYAMYLHSFGYNKICMNCNKELTDLQDMRTVEQLFSDDEVHKLDGRQTVKNFVKHFINYQKEPNGKTLDVLWRLFCWACHEDHTASCAINEIMKWQNFKFVDEWGKYKDD